MEDLYRYVPKQYLPIEYGGSNGLLTDITKKLEDELQDFNYYFKENDKYGVDENLRQEQRMDMSSIFGLEGTFRKLDID